MNKNARSRGWCFTYNNYDSDGEAKVRDIKAKYLIFGREVGEKGTSHLQGYVYFANGKSFSAVKNYFPKEVHIEPAKGNPEQNVEYCSKDGDIFEKGKKPMSQKDKGQTEQDRWKVIKQQAKEGKLDDIDAKVFVHHYRTLRSIAADYQRIPESADSVTGIWYYGDSGAGKTTIARTTHGSDYFLKAPTKWWDGYKGQDVVILDDLDKYHKALGYYVKMWGDKWPFVAEVKGSSLTIRPKKFIVTSQYSPEQIWDDEETVSAVRRRFKMVHVPNLKKRSRRRDSEVSDSDSSDFRIKIKKPKLTRQDAQTQDGIWSTPSIVQETPSLSSEEGEALHALSSLSGLQSMEHDP